MNELSSGCARHYYTLPPVQREAYVLYLIRIAYDHKPYRDMLTSTHLIKPNREVKRLFWNGDPSNNLTIAEIVNRYCKVHLKQSTYDLMKNKIELNHIGAIMTDLDNRFAYKKSEQTIKTEDEIDAMIEKRKEATGYNPKPWLVDYYKALMTTPPMQDEKAA